MRVVVVISSLSQSFRLQKESVTQSAITKFWRRSSRESNQQPTRQRRGWATIQRSHCGGSRGKSDREGPELPTPEAAPRRDIAVAYRPPPPPPPTLSRSREVERKLSRGRRNSRPASPGRIAAVGPIRDRRVGTNISRGDLDAAARRKSAANQPIRREEISASRIAATDARLIGQMARRACAQNAGQARDAVDEAAIGDTRDIADTHVDDAVAIRAGKPRTTCRKPARRMHGAG